MDGTIEEIKYLNVQQFKTLTIIFTFIEIKTPYFRAIMY